MDQFKKLCSNFESACAILSPVSPLVLATPAEVRAIMLSPHDHANAGLVKDKWLQTTMDCGCLSNQLAGQKISDPPSINPALLDTEDEYGEIYTPKTG